MRLYVRTIWKKVIENVNHSHFLFPFIPQDIFINRSIPRYKVLAYIHKIKNQLEERNISYNLGSLYTLPHPIAVKAYSEVLAQNPNNLGYWAVNYSRNVNTRIEFEVIKKMIFLYHSQRENIGGYVTSGGTEGNLFSTWLGRSYLEKYCKRDEICLLVNSLSHYSIQKSGNICNIPKYILELDKQKWNIDITGLRHTISKLIKQGKLGFLLPLTLGYTSTGTSDNISEIIKAVNSIRAKFKDAHFFIWIDAALNGLIAPFISNDFEPFASSQIKAFVVDFHKFGQVPYPAGVVLYRDNLRKLVEKSIQYLAEKDSTILGSRPGMSAISIWAMIHSFGRQGYKKVVLTQKMNKNLFIEKISKVLPDTEVISDKNSLSCGVIFHSLKNKRLPKYIEDKYWLYPSRTKLIFYQCDDSYQTIYKFYFLPHMEKKIILEFVDDLMKL